jgi:hypothetical protein
MYKHARLECLLERDVSVIAEAAFQHHRWEPMLSRIAMSKYVRVILCDVPAAVAFERMESRVLSEPERLLLHHDNEVLERREQDYTPPQLSVPTLTVNTRNGYDPSIDSIAAFARAANLPC